jgi:tripartite-type tricarboxylate transporter receptor subunit TctC
MRASLLPAFVLGCAATALVSPSHAQSQESAGQYPTRPVRMIIPFAPGGASDFIGRILQPKLSEVLGQQVVAENRPGASGNIGVELAARSTPDGYTFLLGNVSSMGINPSMVPNFPIRSTRDFIPITLVVDVPGAFGVHGGLPVNNLKEFIAYAKERPGQLNYGSAGYGSAQRMALEYFMSKAGIKIVHVPYKGGAGAATTATIAGEVCCTMVTTASLAGILLSEIGRRFHARQDDHRAAVAGFLDDRRQVLFHLGHGKAAQAVVAAKRHDQHLHVALERPVETPDAPRGRVAGQAGVHDFEAIPGFVYLLLEQRRIGVLLEQAQSRRQAVAVGDHAATSRRCIGIGGGGRGGRGGGRPGFWSAGRRPVRTGRQEAGDGDQPGADVPADWMHGLVLIIDASRAFPVPSAVRKVGRPAPATSAATSRDTEVRGPGGVRHGAGNTERMARGWESKSVESQQEEMSRATPRGPAPTAEQVARAERRRTLELQRRRVEAEIARATAPAHRHMLEEALLALTAKMAELD